MNEFELHTEMVLPRPLGEVFAFFSEPRNLEKLTPGFLHFEILNPEAIEMKAGALIHYRLRVRGIPLRWQSEITAWDPPFRFVDEQRRGPYRTWVHEHCFEEEEGATRVSDHVRYSHLGGRLVNRFLVAPDLNRVFLYRQQVLKDLFG